MTTPDINERLTALIDGELTPAEAAEVERALADDPALSAEYDELLAAVDFVREHGPVDAPPDFHARVMAATEELPMPGGFWRRVTRFFREMPVETLAVAVAALLVAVVIGTPPSEEEPDAVAVAPEAVEAQPQPALLPPSEVTPSPAAQPRGAPAVGAARPAGQPQPPPPVATADRQQVLDELLGAESGEGGQDGVAALAPSEVEGGGAAGSASAEIGEDLTQQLQAPVSFSLRSADAQALIQLQQLAQNLGGALIDRRTGAPVDSRRLKAGEGPVALSVRIPGDKVSDFSQAAARIGQLEVISQRSNTLYSGGQIDVMVDLSFTGASE